MGRTTFLTTAMMFLCGVLSLSFLNPCRAFAQRDQSQLTPGSTANNGDTTDPAWLQWISSDAGKRALHHSSHPAAPGLLMALGEEPIISILPSHPDAHPDAIAIDTSLADSVTPCSNKGVQNNKEPIGGDPLALFLGNTQPYNKIPTGIDFAPGGGLNKGDFVLGTAWDQGGLFGRNGNSLSLVAVHYKDSVAGTPGCNANLEFGLPDFTDSSGVGVSGFSDVNVSFDTASDRFYLSDIHTGSATTGAENDVALGITTRKTMESAACSGATEGKAKNQACVPTIFPIFGFSYNRTMNTGIEIVHVKTAINSNYLWVAFSEKNLSAGGTTFVDGAYCQLPVTGPTSCTPLGGMAFSSLSSNPITGFAITPDPTSNDLLGWYTEGSPSGETLLFNRCKSSFPSALSCGTPTTIGTFIPATQMRGQQFFIGSGVSGGGIGSTYIAAVNVCPTTPVSTPAKLNECGGPALKVWASTDGGVSWIEEGLASQAGSQFFNEVSVDPSNFHLTYFTTGNDRTNQSFTMNDMVIPTALTTPTTNVLTPNPIDPSSDFSTGGTQWGPPIVSPNRNNVIYLHFPTTNAAVGTWGNNTNQGRETNALFRATE